MAKSKHLECELKQHSEPADGRCLKCSEVVTNNHKSQRGTSSIRHDEALCEELQNKCKSIKFH